MRGLLSWVTATALVALSPAGAVADPAGPGTEFSGTLAFGACPSDRPDLDVPRIVEPFTDQRLEGGVSITGWSSGDPSACVWFGSWLIGHSDDGWVEVASPRMVARDGTATQYTSVLVGTGVNDGLLAVSQVTVTEGLFDFDGRIVGGDIDAIRDYSGVIVPADLGVLDW
jgi:hypothetical protein